MLQLLQPIWLWAGTAIFIPVAIHLWNVKPGASRKVGSILLFAGNVKLRARSTKLFELLLLLLRCLLLLTLTILLAKPVWRQSKNTIEKGWLLIPQDEISQAYTMYQPLIDSLLQQGFILHNFNESFGERNLQTALQQKGSITTESSLSYWALLNRLDKKIPDSLPVYLFTDNKLKHITGARPRLSSQVHWYTFKGNDTAANWLHKACWLPGDSIRITTGSSRLSGTQYASQNVSLYGADYPYRITNNNRSVILEKKNELRQVVTIDTTSFTVIIYTKTFSEDASYVVAALKAVKEVMQYNIKTSLTNDIKVVTGKYDWLFWLSDEALPDSLMKNNVLMYASGKSTGISSSLITDNFTSLGAIETISVHQIVPANDSSVYQTVWKDNYENPVLSFRRAKANVYCFYSHFNPQWNDLVWSNRFPQVMNDLMLGDKQKNLLQSKDMRMIDTSQIQPAQAVDKHSSAIYYKTNNDISIILWLAALLFFVAERLLSFQLKRNR